MARDDYPRGDVFSRGQHLDHVYGQSPVDTTSPVYRQAERLSGASRDEFPSNRHPCPLPTFYRDSPDDEFRK